MTSGRRDEAVAPLGQAKLVSSVADVRWSVRTWRGTVGSIAQDLGRQDFGAGFADGIGMREAFMRTPRGRSQAFIPDFKSRVDEIERHLEAFAAMEVDVMFLAGAPYMFAHGYKSALELVETWESRWGIPVVTTATAQVEAMRAMGMRRIVGLSYFDSRGVNDLTVEFMSDAGIDLAEITSIGCDFAAANHVPAAQLYACAKALFLRHEPADGIYFLGGGWQDEPAIEALEQDLQVPVIGGRGPDYWAIEHRLRVRQPRGGLGRILSEFPPRVDLEK